MTAVSVGWMNENTGHWSVTHTIHPDEIEKGWWSAKHTACGLVIPTASNYRVESLGGSHTCSKCDDIYDKRAAE